MTATIIQRTLIAFVVMAIIGLLSMFSDRMIVVLPELTTEMKTTPPLVKPKSPKKPKHEIAKFLPNVLSGMIDAHPKDFDGRIAMSFRGSMDFLSLSQGVEFLQQHCDMISESVVSADFRVGLSFLESRPRGTLMDFTTFVEFLVLAYQSLHTLAAACLHTNTIHRSERWSTLRRGNPSIQVPWIYIPTRNTKDIGEVHLMAADAIFRAFVSTGILSSQNRISQTTKLFGYEANDDRTRNKLEQPSDLLTAHQKIASPVHYQEMIATADALIALQSSHVPNDNLWLDLDVAQFPFQEWQSDVHKALASITPSISTTQTNQSIVCYFNQQKDRLFQLPDVYHKLLKQHFSLHREVDLRIIPIDSNTSPDLLYLRSQCSNVIGSRSPLLSSIALFLPPRVRMIELWWDQRPIAHTTGRVLAKGLNYTYLGVYRGQVIKEEEDEDEATKKIPDPQSDHNMMRKIMLHGFQPLEEFLNVGRLHIKTEGK